MGQELGRGARRAAMIGAMALLALFLQGCAAERPVKRVIGDSRRVLKADLEGTYVFLKSFKDVRNPGALLPIGATGLYQIQNELVRFRLTENWMHVVALDPLYKEGAIEERRVLASFPVEHIDVLRKQNEDGNDTHEEEVTDKRRPWQSREYVSVDFTADAHDTFGKEKLQSVSRPEGIEKDNEKGLLQFDVEKELVDGSQVVERYSFLAFRPDPAYEQRLYPRPLQIRFGLFKTRTYGLDAFGRVTQEEQRDYINRWPTDKPIIYYLSPDFPDRLKDTVEKVFALWNQGWKKAIGKAPLELRPNSGQAPGDLRYNLVYYVPGRSSGGLLGYGPSVTNPRTGQILKADVYLYGGTLSESLYYLRRWAKAYEGAELPRLGLAESEHRADDAVERAALAASRGLTLGEALRASGLSLPSLAPVEAVPAGGWHTAGGSFATGSLADLWSPVSLTALKSKQSTGDERLFAPLLGAAGDGVATIALSLARDTALGAKLPDSPETTEGERRQDLLKNMTRVDGYLPAIRDGITVDKLSDRELERLVFAGLLAHELGHNFGLRHNFMGSVDKAHFAAGARTSSAMDYAFALHDPEGPAPYDVAALKIAYGPSSASEALVSERFLYCTDEEAMTSRNALCGLHDSGTTLVEVAQNQLSRYRVSYDIYNRRLGRSFFSNDPKRYLGGVASHLVPMRQLIDHAHAILRRAKALERAAAGSPEESRAAAQLWALLRARIEADPTTVSPIELVLTDGMGVKIDPAKIATATLEAQFASRVAFNALSAVVEDSSRLEEDEEDLVHGDLQLKGVLPDKLVALVLLGGSTPEPLTNETQSLYERMDESLLAVFRSVLSNTRSAGNRAIAFQHNPTLRLLAREILIRDLGRPARLSAESMELIHVESVRPRDPDADALREVAGLRTELRKLLLEAEKEGLDLFRLRLDRTERQVRIEVGELTPEEKRKLEQEIEHLTAAIEKRQQLVDKHAQERAVTLRKLDATRATFPVAETKVGESRLKAPLTLGGGLSALTASGVLLRDGLNPVEDRLSVYAEFLAGPLKVQIDAATKAAEEAGDPGKIRVLLMLQDLQAQIEGDSTILRRYAQMERQFLAKLYQAYKPN